MATVIHTGIYKTVAANIFVVPTTGKRFFEFIPRRLLNEIVNPVNGAGVKKNNSWLINIQKYLFMSHWPGKNIHLAQFADLCIKHQFTHIMFTDETTMA